VGLNELKSLNLTNGYPNNNKNNKNNNKVKSKPFELFVLAGKNINHTIAWFLKRRPPKKYKVDKNLLIPCQCSLLLLYAILCLYRCQPKKRRAGSISTSLVLYM
jgi:hypothetical protein